VFVEGQYAGAPFQRLLVAQDTGGAIRRGPLRGDVFWGSGPEAGRAAEQMNGPARWWTLLPRGAPIA
jgi:membrane-bound lytic murein transglycosylase A